MSATTAIIRMVERRLDKVRVTAMTTKDVVIELRKAAAELEVAAELIEEEG